MKTAIVKSTYNLSSVETYEGETIETKVARIVQEKAPITDGAPEPENEAETEEQNTNTNTNVNTNQNENTN